MSVDLASRLGNAGVEPLPNSLAWFLLKGDLAIEAVDGLDEQQLLLLATATSVVEIAITDGENSEEMKVLHDGSIACMVRFGEGFVLGAPVAVQDVIDRLPSLLPLSPGQSRRLYASPSVVMVRAVEIVAEGMLVGPTLELSGSRDAPLFCVPGPTPEQDNQLSIEEALTAIQMMFRDERLLDDLAAQSVIVEASQLRRAANAAGRAALASFVADETDTDPDMELDPASAELSALIAEPIAEVLVEATDGDVVRRLQVDIHVDECIAFLPSPDGVMMVGVEPANVPTAVAAFLDAAPATSAVLAVAAGDEEPVTTDLVRGDEGWVSVHGDSIASLVSQVDRRFKTADTA